MSASYGWRWGWPRACRPNECRAIWRPAGDGLLAEPGHRRRDGAGNLAGRTAPPGRLCRQGIAAHLGLPDPGEHRQLPEDKALSRELRDVVAEAIAELPPGQRAVITLRDVEGWSTPEVSGLSPTRAILEKQIL